MRLPLFAVAILLAACAPPEVDETQAAIIGGTTDTGDPSVVLVLGEGAVYHNTCSGSIIAPHLVLTAAHCVDTLTDSLSIGLNYTYDLGDPTPGANDTIPVESSLIAPGYDTSVIPHLHDIAIVRVGPSLGTPLPYHGGAAQSSWIGQPLRIVGYGKTGAKLIDEGTRRSVTTEVFDISATEIVIDNSKQPCGGDSGGPAFLTLNGISTIVGVASASTADCLTTGYYGRIDNDIAFINGVLAGTSGGGTAGATSVVPKTSSGGCNVAGDGKGGLAELLLVLFALLMIRIRPRGRVTARTSSPQ
ncbi:MAG: trypsin-like serine protease [Polyangia bacterium]